MIIFQQKVQAASRISQGKAQLALSLIGYPDEVSAAMSFVFGDTLICADAESAKAVTFNREVGARSVTVDGDVYDPSGTLSGGAAPSGSGILTRVQELQQVKRKLREAQERLRGLEEENRRSEREREAWRRMVGELELKEHEKRLLEEQVEGSNAARVSHVFKPEERCAHTPMCRCRLSLRSKH